MTAPLGHHLIGEFHRCHPRALDDAAFLEEHCLAAVRACGAHVVDWTFRDFPEGASGIVLLEESHFAIHTWAKEGLAFVDVFTCGKLDPEPAWEYLKCKLGPRHIELRKIERGTCDG